MARDVQKYCDSCHNCMTSKNIPRKQKSPMTIRDPAPAPFQSICIDAVGPLPKAGIQEYQHIHVIVDFYSKYVIAFPTKSTDSQSKDSMHLSLTFMDRLNYVRATMEHVTHQKLGKIIVLRTISSQCTHLHIDQNQMGRLDV